MRSRAFRQIDVFTDVPFLGNPVAVVLEGDGLADAEMAAFARWTNLSETTFVLPPTDARADYRLRIFTPSGELPFAGHPTLGSCHAWLTAGAAPRSRDLVVQECAAGLIDIRRDGARLAFAAPPRVRQGPLDAALVRRIATGLAIDPAAVVDHAWVDNGPGWCAVLLGSAREVLALRPDWSVLGDTKLGVVGPYDADALGPDGAAFELRAFFPGAADGDGTVSSGFEDPVTGSLNASVAQWLREQGRAPARYVASQGTALQRAGRVHVRDDGDRVWVGGDCAACIAGVVAI